jgi:nitrite reductase (cytochrome c-552)
MKRSTLIALIVTTALAAAVVTALLVNIFERKQEARNPFFRVVELTDETIDPQIWGKNFPLQYDGYLQTVDQIRTKYGGSEALPHAPTEADPRSVVAQSRLEEDPRLKTMWAGYPFAVDFRKKRGHAYMLEDQTYTQRVQQFAQPGTCLHCHASVYVPYKQAGGGDLIKGFEVFNHMPYQEARKKVEHPIACIDCHEPQTMQLRVTRPGFLEGIRALKASQGIENYDPNTMATRQEMRTYVCGQCHVEYYFKGPEKRLTYPWFKGITVDQIADYEPNTMATRQEMRAFVCGQCHVEYYFKGPEKRLVYPWSKGLKIDDIQAYYDEVGHKDWVHADSGAPVLKAQHPEFELWNQGIHARSGVACADCHMPYMRVGALKISDHHVRSPLLNINRACQTCHKWPEAELKARAEAIQDRVFGLRNRAMDAVVALIGDLKTAREGGRTDAELGEARRLQRLAQFRLDFVEAENSMGFHAPQEAERILAESIDFARQGQLALRGGVTVAAR